MLESPNMTGYYFFGWEGCTKIIQAIKGVLKVFVGRQGCKVLCEF